MTRTRATTTRFLLLLLLLTTFLPGPSRSQAQPDSEDDSRPEDESSSAESAEDEAALRRQQELELKRVLSEELRRAQELDRARLKPSTQLEEPRYDSGETQSGEAEEAQSAEDETPSGDDERPSADDAEPSADDERPSGDDAAPSSEEESAQDEKESTLEGQDEEAAEPFVYNAHRDNFYDLELDGSYVYGYAAPHGVRRYERGFHSGKHKGLVVEGFYTQPRHFGHRLLYELRCYRSDVHGFRPLKVAYLERPPIVRRGAEPDVDCFDHH